MEALKQERIAIDTAARQLGTTPLHLLMQVRAGVIAAEEIDGRWLIDSAQLTKLQRHKAAGGLPEVCASSCAKSGGCASCG